MTFQCTSLNSTICPQSYMVLFHGPSRQNVLPEMFSPVDAESETIRATWIINDPGEYSVYVYPEFRYCLYSETDLSWNAASVEHSPFKITVQPNSPPLIDGYGSCFSSADVLAGRYLSTNSLTLSSIFANSSRAFAWAPYKCKIPPRTAAQALDLMPSAKHVVFIGDSLSRGGFCARIWGSIRGSIEGSVCDYLTNFYEYIERKWEAKHTWRVIENHNEARNVSVSLCWAPVDLSDIPPPSLFLPPPTHVVFNQGMYEFPAKDTDI